MEQVRMAPIDTVSFIVGKTHPVPRASRSRRRWPSSSRRWCCSTCRCAGRGGRCCSRIVAVPGRRAGHGAADLDDRRHRSRWRSRWRCSSRSCPTILLSGFIFPIASMPAALQVVTYLVPARYFLVALRGIVLKGVGLATIWPQLAALGRLRRRRARARVGAPGDGSGADDAGAMRRLLHDLEGTPRAAAGPAAAADRVRGADPPADRARLRRDDRRAERADGRRRRRSVARRAAS